MRIGMVLSILLWVALSGCGPTNTGISGEGASPTSPEVSSTPTLVPADLPTLTETYTDNISLVAIDHPAGWHLTDLSDENKQNSMAYTIVMTSWSPEQAGRDGIPQGGTKVDLTVMKDSVPLDDFVAIRRQMISMAVPAEQIISEDSWQLADGLPAVRLLVRSNMGDIPIVLTVLNQNNIILSGYGNIALFDQIAQTLRAVR
jgi:hypothetical protein